MNILNKVKRTKVNNNADFLHCVYLFVDAVEDYFFNYDPKKESQIILIYNFIKNNLIDYKTNTEFERKEKQELLGALEDGIDGFKFRKEYPCL